jgi:hypothetical protein
MRETPQMAVFQQPAGGKGESSKLVEIAASPFLSEVMR